jgi:hypothetical protein
MALAAVTVLEALVMALAAVTVLVMVLEAVMALAAVTRKKQVIWGPQR